LLKNKPRLQQTAKYPNILENDKSITIPRLQYERSD
jgi:hypothetical protein